MPKFRYHDRELKNKVHTKDIEFDIRDVQTKNPRMNGRTPLHLYTKDPIAPHLKKKKSWWEDDTK